MTLIHGIVPRRCPTAYAAPSQHGSPVSDADQLALRQHAQVRDAKSIAASLRAAERGLHMSQFSPRNRRQP